jgi:hypothetical protein
MLEEATTRLCALCDFVFQKRVLPKKIGVVLEEQPPTEDISALRS